MSVTAKLRETIRELFSEDKVDLFIAWEEGSLPMSSTPLFITDRSQADRAIFDPRCGNNLSVYFTKDSRQFRGKRVGIAVKGCDARSLVLNIQENQVQRDRVVIVGVPCNGVIDGKKIRKKTGGKRVTEVIEDGDSVTVKGADYSITLDRSDVLSSSCLTCIHPDATEYDIFLGVARSEVSNENRRKELDEVEALSSAQRWERTRKEYEKCIRCYACRNVCPSCYCSECFVDQNDPQWIGNTCDVTDTVIFHLIRNLHVAGRCVECGACARACPMDIDLLLLNRKTAEEIKERFGDTAGISISGRPVMAEYREDEKQEFIMG
jgi:formate dehydrogenase subunit beta